MIIYTSDDGKYDLHWGMSGMHEPRGLDPLIPQGPGMGTGNCGMGVLTGGWLGWKRRFATQNAHVPWETGPWYINYPGAALHERVRPTDLPQLSDEKLWELFLLAVPKFADQQNYSIYSLSNGVSRREKSVLDMDAANPICGGSRFNMWLLRAIRELKCGTLITTPIVENQMHAGDGAIMAAFWIPPAASKDRVLHGKVGISMGYSDEDVKKARDARPAMLPGLTKFVEHFYGRKTVAERIKDRDNEGRTAGVDAAAR